jgi:hypothetical protein
MDKWRFYLFHNNFQILAFFFAAFSSILSAVDLLGLSLLSPSLLLVCIEWLELLQSSPTHLNSRIDASHSTCSRSKMPGTASTEFCGAH